MRDPGEAQCGTIRLKLLKIGARVRVTFRKVWISMASGYPYIDLTRELTEVNYSVGRISVKRDAKERTDQLVDQAKPCRSGEMARIRSSLGPSGRFLRFQPGTRRADVRAAVDPLT